MLNSLNNRLKRVFADQMMSGNSFSDKFNIITKFLDSQEDVKNVEYRVGRFGGMSYYLDENDESIIVWYEYTQDRGGYQEIRIQTPDYTLKYQMSND